MDKGLTVPKREPKIPQMPQNLSAQIVCPSQNFWEFDEKWLHWASIVHALMQLATFDTLTPAQLPSFCYCFTTKWQKFGRQ